MKRGWTKSLLCASAVSGLLLFTAAVPTGAHTQGSDAPSPVNELTIAGLRPGRDSLGVVLKRFKAKYVSSSDPGPKGMKQWGDACTGRSLAIEVDDRSVVQRVTLSSLVPQDGKCIDHRIDALDMKDWVTGRGLRLGDSRDRATDLYGEPQSSGPSIKGNKQLEFMYYAFDWAGPDVPQIMEIYCERETGRVLEISLAYSSAHTQ